MIDQQLTAAVSDSQENTAVCCGAICQRHVMVWAAACSNPDNDIEVAQLVQTVSSTAVSESE